MNNNGKQGEKLFKEFMQSQGYQVQDVTEDKEYQYKDIDFILTSPTTGLTKTFEVKWDSKIHNTNNLYLELTNINSRQWQGLGWYEMCRADYLVYGDSVTRRFYVLALPRLRERVTELPQREGRCGYESTGLLINLDDIRDIIE